MSVRFGVPLIVSLVMELDGTVFGGESEGESEVLECDSESVELGKP